MVADGRQQLCKTKSADFFLKHECMFHKTLPKIQNSRPVRPPAQSLRLGRTNYITNHGTNHGSNAVSNHYVVTTASD
jgi:hypothetical protein